MSEETKIKKQTWQQQYDAWLQSEEREALIDQCDSLINLTRLAVRINFQEPSKNGLCFYDEPASKGHHGNSLGGLARHCLKVLEILVKLNAELPEKERLDKESMITIAFLHDWCKVGTLYPWKNKDGSLNATSPFFIQDELPLGHGEKSLAMISAMEIQLSFFEQVLIRWHMGPFDYSYKGSQTYLQKAYPYHLLLYIADHFATMLEGDAE